MVVHRPESVLSRVNTSLRDRLRKAVLGMVDGATIQALRVIELAVGTSTVKMAANKLNFSTGVTLTTAGDFGRDADADPVWYDGSVKKLPYKDEVVLRDGTQAFTGDQSVGGFKLTSLGAPSASTDAATKDYVDTSIQGLDYKESVRVATTAALPAVTASGIGIGKTLTADALGVLTVDDVATVLNDRILVKNQAAGANNGIYKVTTQGTAGVAFVLTRAIDADQDTDLNAGSVVPVEEGTANGNTLLMLTTDDPIVIDTTLLVFSSFSSLTDHNALLGLADDDHAQYALLAGRAGTANDPTLSASIDGTLTGSTTSAKDLILKSNASDNGFVQVTAGTGVKVKKSSGTAILVGDGAAATGDIMPSAHGTGNIGASGTQWLSVHAATIQQNDSRFVGYDHDLVVTEYGGTLWCYDARKRRVVGGMGRLFVPRRVQRALRARYAEAR